MPKVQDIRKMARAGCSVAEISRETGVSEPTVRKYIRKADFSPAVPAKKKAPSMLDEHKPVVDMWIEEDRRNWHKQRHTATRIHERLVAEHGFEGSYSTVQRYVKEYKAAHKDQRDEYLDLEWRPGEMQVDFGQADFRVVGVRKRLHDLVCDFPFSNVGLAQVFPGETAECVCEGLMAVFRYIGGVPTRIVFDNATGVGRRICGEIRTSSLFAAFAEHFGFDYSFCNPRSGWEKGGVENKVGALRRSLFVPVPSFDRVDLYNKRLLDECMRMADKEHYLKGEPESQLFQEDLFAMSGLPAAPYSCVRWVTPKADKKGRVRVDGRHWYSTDPSLAGLELPVALGAATVEVHAPDGALVCTHRRAYGKAPTDTSDPGSQLALLANRPGAWDDSRVRAALPDDLRGYMDSLERPRRSESIRLLRDQCAESGWDATVGAASEALAATGRVDEASVAAVLARSRSGAVVYDDPVDLTVYDAAMGAL